VTHDIRIYESPELLAEAAATLVVTALRDALIEQGRAVIALSGGSTPRALHEVLARGYANALDWTRIDFFWGDERCVPPDDAASNYRMAVETLLTPLGIANQQIHRIKGELKPDAAAEAYEQALRNFFPQSVTFDVVLLGMGDDGHTASLFPQTAALDEDKRWVVANRAPVVPYDRVTLTFPVLNAARMQVALIAGGNKAARLREVLYGAYDPDQFPIQRLRPVNGSLIWMVDAAAGALLHTS
jgi:6-phosphogluconolactonase